MIIKDILHVTIYGILIMTIICFVCIPFLWLDGNAKSDYLEQSQNISLPWYKACFLKVNATGIGANITHKEVYSDKLRR